MKIKTSELSGAALDWAVSVAGEYEANGHRPRLGWSTRTDVPRYWCVRHQVKDVGWFADYEFCPSRDWSQGGPIIDRERIDLSWQSSGRADWMAYGDDQTDAGVPLYAENGPTPLVAAMRCFVASKLGDEVDVPQELLA